MGKIWGFAAAGFCAGMVTGLFGAGGGMVLVPLLTYLTDIRGESVFPASISVIAPLCLVGLMSSPGPLPWSDALPYLLGGGIGGAAAGLWGRKIPVKWLHRGLGILILCGGFRWLLR